jgi:hypothetical protein
MLIYLGQILEEIALWAMSACSFPDKDFRALSLSLKFFSSIFREHTPDAHADA